MAAICFDTVLLKIVDWTLLRLPENASIRLPSRGMALVQGTMNGFHSKIVLKPNGKASHWFRVDSGPREAAGIIAGDAVAFSKLNACERRPCCFNRNLCTKPEVSKNGVFINPTHVRK